MTIPCGQTIWNDSFRGRDCTREAMWTLVDEPGMHDVYCNVHKAGKMRSHYSTYNFKPLTDDMRASLTATLNERREEQRKKQEKAHAEQEERNDKYRANAWAELSKDASFRIEEDKATHGTRDDWWTYYAGIDPRGGIFNSMTFDLKTEGEGYPYGIRVRSTGTLTPNEARKVAEALVDAADKADSLNAERKPNGD